MHTGFIQLHRRISKWEWYTDANTFRLFIHLLLNANHDFNRWQGIDINRGQLVTGRKQLAKELGLSEQQIRTSYNKLIKTSEITSKPTNKYTLVTITGYDSYQSDKRKATSNPTNKQPTSNQQVTTNNNDNNVNNDNKKDIWLTPEWINEKAWNEFIQHRNEIKKPITNLAKTKAANCLNGFTPEEQQAAVDKTIQNRWSGLFPEKIGIQNETRITNSKPESNTEKFWNHTKERITATT